MYLLKFEARLLKCQNIELTECVSSTENTGVISSISTRLLIDSAHGAPRLLDRLYCIIIVNVWFLCIYFLSIVYNEIYPLWQIVQFWINCLELINFLKRDDYESVRGLQIAWGLRDQFIITVATMPQTR